jgi:hypothetical protein
MALRVVHVQAAPVAIADSAQPAKRNDPKRKAFADQTAPTGHQIGSRALRQRSIEVESPDRNIVCRFRRSLR